TPHRSQESPRISPGRRAACRGIRRNWPAPRTRPGPRRRSGLVGISSCSLLERSRGPAIIAPTGDLSAPNLFGSPPAGTFARQRGACSRIKHRRLWSPTRCAAGGCLRRHAQRRRAMPTNKDLKRLVRSRMKKTGESYTAARAQVTKKKTSTKAKSASTAKAKSALKSDFEKVAGTSDAIMEATTGCGWEKWVYVLDKWGAIDKTHTEIATHVHKKYKIDGWWAQCVTVGYERIRGLRARGQRRDGRWEASKSKTYAVPVAELFDAWNTAK